MGPAARYTLRTIPPVEGLIFLNEYTGTHEYKNLFLCGQRASLTGFAISKPTNVERFETLRIACTKVEQYTAPETLTRTIIISRLNSRINFNENKISRFVTATAHAKHFHFIESQQY